MRSRIRVVGGAPPPPLGCAPQGLKKGPLFDPWRSLGEGRFSPEDHSPGGGVGGVPPATGSRVREGGVCSSPPEPDLAARRRVTPLDAKAVGGPEGPAEPTAGSPGPVRGGTTRCEQSGATSPSRGACEETLGRERTPSRGRSYRGDETNDRRGLSVAARERYADASGSGSSRRRCVLAHRRQSCMLTRTVVDRRDPKHSVSIPPVAQRQHTPRSTASAYQMALVR